jgi:alpha-glucosidase
MIKRLLLLPLFCVITTVAQANTASEQVSTFIIASPQLQTTRKYGVPPKGLYKFNKRYFLYMHAQNLFDSKTSYAEWNIDEKLDSINAELIVIGIEHGNDKRMDELTP